MEDEPLVLLVAQDALEAGGYVVVPATSAADALEALENQHEEFAGLVTDIRLGGGPKLAGTLPDAPANYEPTCPSST